MTELSETNKLMLGILRTPYNKEYQVRVRFGTGAIVEQRVRVAISRVRAKAIKAGMGKKVQPFKLRAAVAHPEGNAYDLVTFTKVLKTHLTVDMSDLDKIMMEVIEEARPKIEERKKQVVTIKRAGVA